MTVIAGRALLAEGECLLACRHLPEAIECFQRAKAAGTDPNRCASCLWMAYMLSGHFESAWLESDAIRDRGTPDPNRFWQGESLVDKRVILRCLHGFGDATQFLRYAPRLRLLTSSLIVEVPPRLLTLARCFDGVDDVVTWGALASSSPPPWDVQIEVMELSYIFRTQLTELPLATKYLRLPASRALQTIHLGHLRVGLAWNAGSWNPARAISPKALLPILAVRGCEFWSLEGGPDFIKSMNPIAFHMHEDAVCRDSIEGLATTISQLDLVITVDTLAAHLAGALGVNTWVLIQHEADWRWMHDRSDSPWYPSIRLFRQSAPGDWDGAIKAVCQALQAEVSIEHEVKAADNERT